jgi:hypothetical protein
MWFVKKGEINFFSLVIRKEFSFLATIFHTLQGYAVGAGEKSTEIFFYREFSTDDATLRIVFKIAFHTHGLC